MRVRLSLHKDNMVTVFTVKEIYDDNNITDEAAIKDQLMELYRIFKLFEENEYNPQIFIKEK